VKNLKSIAAAAQHKADYNYRGN